MTPLGWGRVYFASQAIAGAVWWVFVFLSPWVREATLGSLAPVPVAIFDVPLFVGASAAAALGLRHAALIATGWAIIVTVALAVFATVTTEAGWGVLLMIAASFGSAFALVLVLMGRVPSEWVLTGPFAFRPARPRSTATAYLAVTGAQILVFWGLFLVAIPLVLTFAERRWGLDAVPFPPAAVPVGVVALVLASALGLWSAAAMSTNGGGTPLPAAMPNRLVVAGPYRYVRNPMALAGIVQGAAVGLLSSSWLVIVYAVCGSLLWNFIVRPLEETDLESRFGDEYRRYRAGVRCWRPRLTAYRASDAVERVQP